MSTTTKEKPKSDAPENEIRVSSRTNVINGVERVEEAFKKFDNVTLSGINDGISNVLLITEIIKLKITNLHQYNLIETITREVHEENKEKESDEHPKYLTRFKVELYKNKLPTPPKGAFYEAPYTEEQITKIKEVKPPERPQRPQTGGRGRGRGRGRGGPRGEGRGGRGRGRGEGRPNTTAGRGGRGGRGAPRGGRGEGRGGRGAPRGGRGEGRGGRGEGRGGRGAPRGGRGEGRGGRGRGGSRGAKKEGGETTQEK